MKFHLKANIMTVLTFQKCFLNVPNFYINTGLHSFQIDLWLIHELSSYFGSQMVEIHILVTHTI